MQGIIIKGIGGFYYVKVDNEIVECKARGKFRFNELTPMVGDKVDISVEKGRGRIDKIFNRSSELIRPAVANVTQAFIVFAVKNPDINEDLLNKFLVSCEYNKLKVIVCFNKLDLADSEQNIIEDMVKSCDYEIVRLRAKQEVGLEEIRAKLKNNISVFCGPSGVGKSTILNKLAGKEIMETGNISERLQRGKHTTRHSELIEVDGGLVVDTPGFSVLDLNFIEKDQLQYCFPEFNPYIDSCKFRGCRHHKEPGCSVKQAVDNGEINKKRYDFYINTLETLQDRRY